MTRSTITFRYREHTGGRGSRRRKREFFTVTVEVRHSSPAIEKSLAEAFAQVIAQHVGVTEALPVDIRTLPPSTDPLPHCPGCTDPRSEGTHACGTVEHP